MWSSYVRRWCTILRKTKHSLMESEVNLDGSVKAYIMELRKGNNLLLTYQQIPH